MKNFTETYLGANLNHSYLAKAMLFNATLTYANLTNSILDGASMIKADLSNARFIGARLVKVRLYEAKLFNTNMYKADLSNAELDGAYVDNPDWIAKLKEKDCIGLEEIEKKYYVSEEQKSGETVFIIREKKILNETPTIQS